MQMASCIDKDIHTNNYQRQNIDKKKQIINS